jgi:hypothetical protein
MKTHITHSNSDLINNDKYSEGHFLREAIAMRSKINWRFFSKKDQLDTKSKKLLAELKSEANKKFNNETVVRYRAV